MSPLFAAVLLALPTTPAHIHHERFEHRGAAVHVTYRGEVRHEARQLGAVSAPGRPTTLRCRWQARVSVERHARHVARHVATRRIEGPALVSGTRPGWCAGQAAAIRADVAMAGERMRAHLVEVAARDRAALVAELDRVQG